ncbi:hypothetical protein CHELA1G11_21701 [Hyphomicrobiales bacterium]|nr:hypothetical protein CHELA1G11_21701 [Hyphomicrobiales bacterium]CAH1695500.1 hypothetical protein CHELA1G2_22006 [Hyphomicrobiales bacterium]
MMLPIEVVALHYHGILRSVSEDYYLTGYSDLQMIALDTRLLSQAYYRTDPVVRLYQGCFGRVPDSDGLDFCVAVYKNTYSIETLANAFSASDEFQEQYAGLSNADIVTKMYENILNRQGDDAGIAFWTKFLDDGGTPAALVMSFSESPEFVELARPYNDLFLRSAANGAQDYEGSLFEPDISGEVLALTRAANTILETERDDFFYSNLERGTLQSSDILDGNGGWDTLWTIASHTIAPTILDIEVLQFWASRLDFDAANVTGVKEIWSVNSSDNVTFSNISLETHISLTSLPGESAVTTLRYTDTDGDDDTAQITVSGGA